MKIEHDGKSYETIYYPFFRVERHSEGFDIYTLRLPSGHIEEIPIFETNQPTDELKDHLVFLLREFALEEDDVLTPKAMEIKRDVRALFGID
jgi:hypothetical protein